MNFLEILQYAQKAKQFIATLEAAIGPIEQALVDHTSGKVQTELKAIQTNTQTGEQVVNSVTSLIP